MAYDTFTFNIVKSLGIISQRTDHTNTAWTKEVNLVSWNGREPKVDIREWNADHTKMSKGITFTDDEAEKVCMILHNHIAEGSKL